MSLEEAGVRLIDCVHKTPAAAEEGLPYLAIPQMKTGCIDLSDARRITPEDFEEWTQKANPETHDVVLSRRCNPGVTAAVPRDTKFALGQNLVLLRSSGARIHKPYLKWLVRSPHWWDQIGKYINVGAVFDSLRCADVPKFELPVPPLDEQRRIAAVFGALDDKIELNRKMNRTLEEMAQALFRSWFVDFDAKHDRRVQDLIARGDLVVSDGYRAKRVELDDAGLPFARAANINDGFRFDGAELLGEEGVLRAKHKVSQPLDVVFTSKGTVGRFAFVMPSTRRFAYSPQLCFWRSANVEALSPYFLLYWMRSPAFLRQVAAVKGQTDMADYVSLRDQKRMKIAVPPPHRQADFEQRVRPLVERAAQATAQSRTLADLRDALLPKLVSGEIRVPEAEKAVEEVA